MIVVWLLLCLVCGVCGVSGVARCKTRRVYISNRPRVYRQHVHMFHTCGRVADTHGDVLNVHMGVGFIKENTRRVVTCPRGSPSKRWILHILIIGRGQHVPDSSDTYVLFFSHAHT